MDAHPAPDNYMGFQLQPHTTCAPHLRDAIFVQPTD
jgi:hypothetical protein